MKQQLMVNNSALIFAQKLISTPKPAYSMKDAIPLASSMPTAYRHLNALKSLGIAKSNRGYFVLNTSVISQPHLIDKIMPSLEALKMGRRFGRYYNDLDIKFVTNNIPCKLVTLDYKAWELTEFQYPMDLYMYVDDVERVASQLKDNQFHEGKKGHVVILPAIGNFDNEIERVYLDCIAKGGRSMLDAIAIELLYSHKIRFRGRFTAQDIMKVQEDLRAQKSNASTSARSH